MRKLSEENVTKIILSNLIKNDWKIVCFDFPQSGTGIILHPNSSEAEKNKGSITPDIIAVKKNLCLYFENKDRTYFPDFEKINMLRTKNCYSNALSDLLKPLPIQNIFYGIGLPTQKCTRNALDNSNLVDFILGVDSDRTIRFLYNKDPEQIII